MTRLSSKETAAGNVQLSEGNPPAQRPVEARMRWSPLVLLSLAACTRPIATARLSANDVPMREELAAKERIDQRRCHVNWGLAFPGIGQLCLGQRDGAAIAGVAAADLAAAATAALTIQQPRLGHAAITIPLLAFQETYLYAAADVAIQGDRAARKLYAPQDSTTDLAAAPFNLEVLARPDVLVGVLAGVAAYIGISFLVEETLTLETAGSRANVFGTERSFVAGAPIAAGTFAALDLQVAMGEEALFRGVIQSNLARKLGEKTGVLVGSLAFGLFHAPRALGLKGEERKNFLLYQLPSTVISGLYFGWLYQRSGYSLAPSTAAHFWFNLLLSSAFFAIHPEDSPIAVTYEMRL
jgi:membrane protease YdiL (CAAX protease family)